MQHIYHLRRPITLKRTGVTYSSCDKPHWCPGGPHITTECRDLGDMRAVIISMTPLFGFSQKKKRTRDIASINHRRSTTHLSLSFL